jgi:alkanesulfonate monooxygenase SsuD/methylene tetrahydromethanopterin reductase-like flavin-dependent oxidoreductase (luciferase family)
MRISINVAHRAWDESPRGWAAQLERVVRTADEIGVDTVWAEDRTARPADPAGPPHEAALEICTTLGFLAPHSQRVRLGAMVAPAAFRVPGLIARAATTLDILSGGRARLGLGAGHAEQEPADPIEHFERVEDLLRSAHRMWAGGEGSEFPGAHPDPGGSHACPAGRGAGPGGPGSAPAGSCAHPAIPRTGRARPYAGPRPPVLIAGRGEARMLPLVARYADACTLVDVPRGGATVRGKLGILAVHCRKIGRPVFDIDVSATVRMGPGQTADDLVASCRRFAGLGIGHVVLVLEGPWTHGVVQTLTAAAPVIAGMYTEPGAAPEVTYTGAYRAPAVGAPV